MCVRVFPVSDLCMGVTRNQVTRDSPTDHVSWGYEGSDLIRNDYNWRGKNLHTQSTLSHAGMVSSSKSTACEVTTCQK